MKSLLALTLHASLASALSGYAYSCQWYNLGSDQDGWRLSAGCTTWDGEQRCNGLNLNNCLKNQFGVLLPQEHGNLQGSCWNPYLVDNTHLIVTCSRGNNQDAVDATFDLNQVIGNENGWLTCFDVRGDECA